MAGFYHKDEGSGWIVGGVFALVMLVAVIIWTFWILVFGSALVLLYIIVRDYLAPRLREKGWL